MKPPGRILAIIAIALILTVASAYSPEHMPPENLKGKYSYRDFEPAQKCGSCHTDFYQQWSQAMMSQAYTHRWDEIEYFDLAVAHAKAKPELKEAVDGCNGCHTPMAYMGGQASSAQALREQPGQ